MEPCEAQKDKISILLMLAVNTVEIFINVYFRVLVEENEFSQLREMVLSDLSHDDGQNALGLKSKLNHWPPKVLGRSIAWQKGVGAEFEALRLQRNKLMHFTSNYESFSFENVTINGLADTSVFDDLEAIDAREAYRITIEFIEYILKLRSVSDEQILHDIHYWTGIVPELESET